LLGGNTVGLITHGTLPSGPSTWDIPVQDPARQGAGFVTVLSGTWPEFVEPKRATNSNSDILEVPFPGVINGRFEVPGELDIYRFNAWKGQRLLLRARTRSLGSPCDLQLRLLQADGKKLAEPDPSGADEGSLTNTIPADGQFRLEVSELNRGGGIDFVYRIELTELTPGFELALASDKCEAAPSDLCELKVEVSRRDFDGPIELHIDGLDTTLMQGPAIIAEKKNEVILKFSVPASSHVGELKTFRVMGRARIGGRDYEAWAGTLKPWLEAFPELKNPWPGVNGLVFLSVRP
jgi:hypothetical protein